MAALVIAEHDNHAIRGGTLNAVTAALKCSADVTVLVAGGGCAAAGAAAAAIAGVSKVLLVDAPHLTEQLAEALAEQVVNCPDYAGSDAAPPVRRRRHTKGADRI